MSGSVTPIEQNIEEVVLIIPCTAEYVGIARLAILGIANRVSFSYDEVEDIRLAVGEACGQAIERSSQYYQTVQHGEAPVRTAPLRIAASISESTLTVAVSDSVPITAPVYDNAPDVEGIDYHALGSVLIEILVDQVVVTESSSGTTVKLIKTASSAL